MPCHAISAAGLQNLKRMKHCEKIGMQSAPHWYHHSWYGVSYRDNDDGAEGADSDDENSNYDLKKLRDQNYVPNAH